MKTNLPPATMIMTFHKEGNLAHKSLLGMQRVREYTMNNNGELRLICMLDCADDLTTKIVKDYIQQFGQKHDQVIEIQFGSPAASRNVGIDMTQTQYVGCLDGDDFFSANWVVKSLEEQINSRIDSLICCPEYVINFGNKIENMKAQNSTFIPLSAIVDTNYWSSSTFSDISTYKRNPYNELVNKQVVFAFEDWDFNARSIASGSVMKAVPSTYLFYRRRENSTLGLHTAASTFIPPSSFFDKIVL